MPATHPYAFHHFPKHPMLLQLAACGLAYWLRERDKQEKKKKQAEKPAAVQTTSKAQAISPQTGNIPTDDTVQLAPTQGAPFALTASLGISAISLFNPALAILSIPAVVYTLWVTLQETIDQLKQKRFTVHLLVISTAAAGLLISSTVLASGGALLLFIVNFNLFLGISAHNFAKQVRHDTQTDLASLVSAQNSQVWRIRGDLNTSNPVEIAVPAESLEQGDIIVVQAGELIPADGRIVRGRAAIDQQLLTGESQPVEKEIGDPVFAQTSLTMGQLYIEVEKTGRDTAAAQIAQVLQKTVNYKADMQLWAEKMADQSVIPTLAISSLALPVLGLNTSWAIFVSHPKYKPTLTTYIGIFTYLDLATKAGILIKDGRVFERLNEVDTLVFDKTGTLTDEQPEIAQIYDWQALGPDTILTYAAAAEQKQSHPIAQAILQAARQRQLEIPIAQEINYRISYGLTAKLNDGQTIYLGSRRFIQEEGFQIPAEAQTAEQACETMGDTIIYLARNRTVVGALALRARLRPEAADIINRFRQRGLNEIMILSGDHQIPTYHLAKRLGIKHVVAEALPEDKGKVLDKLQDAGRTVCYVGDGINDALALRKAAVSISLQGATNLALDTAQVVLLKGDLSDLPHLFDLAQQFERDMHRTFGAVVVPHVVGMGAVLFGGMGGVAAVLLSQLGLGLGVGSALLPRLQTKSSENSTK